MNQHFALDTNEIARKNELRGRIEHLQNAYNARMIANDFVTDEIALDLIDELLSAKRELRRYA